MHFRSRCCFASAVLFFLGSLAAPSFADDPTRTDDDGSMRNLALLGKAMQRYAFEHEGRFPSRLGELYEARLVLNLATFTRPGAPSSITTVAEIDEKSSYEIVRNPGTQRPHLMVKEKPSASGGKVLAYYSDRQIRREEPGIAAELLIAAPVGSVVTPTQGFASVPIVIEAKPSQVGPPASKPATLMPTKTAPAETKAIDPSVLEAKPAEAKQPDAQPAEAKLADAKPAEAKGVDDKPADKTAEAKPAEGKPAEMKPAEVKYADAKPADTKSTDLLTDPKPADPRSAGGKSESESATTRPPAAPGGTTKPFGDKDSEHTGTINVEDFPAANLREALGAAKHAEYLTFITLWKRGDAERAEFALQKLLDTWPAGQPFSDSFGRRLALGGFFKGGELCARHSMRMEYRSVRDFGLLAESLILLGRPTDAEAVIHIGLKLFPEETTGLLYDLEWASAEQRKLEEFSEFIRGVIRNRPEESSARELLAAALVKLEKYEEAEAVCRNLIQGNEPPKGDEKIAEPQKAPEEKKPCCGLQEEAPKEAASKEIPVATEAPAANEARVATETPAPTAPPMNLTPYLILANCLHKQGKSNEARRVLDEALDKPESDEPWFQAALAEMWMNHGEKAEAQAAAQRALPKLDDPQSLKEEGPYHDLYFRHKVFRPLGVEVASPCVAVSGAIRIDGKPAAEGTLIQFAGKSNRGAFTVLDAGGAWSKPFDHELQEGLPPGRYSLRIESWQIVTQAGIPLARPLVPPIYRDLKTTTLEIDVLAEGSNAFEIDVPSTGPSQIRRLGIDGKPSAERLDSPAGSTPPTNDEKKTTDARAVWRVVVVPNSGFAGAGIYSIRAVEDLANGIPYARFRHGGASNDHAKWIGLTPPLARGDAVQRLAELIEPHSLRPAELAAGATAVIDGKRVTIDDMSPVPIAELEALLSPRSRE